MVNAIESIGKKLKADGRLVSGGLHSEEGSRELTLTLAFSSAEMTAEVFNALHNDLLQDGFRLGSLRLRAPDVVRDGTEAGDVQS